MELNISMKINLIQDFHLKGTFLSMKNGDSFGGFLWNKESIPLVKIVPRHSTFYLPWWKKENQYSTAFSSKINVSHMKSVNSCAFYIVWWNNGT
jgi:hypothetical protein